VAFIAVISSLFLYLNSPNAFPAKPVSITVGNAQSFECDTLVHIAVDQNLFAKNGLDVTIKNYDSGMVAVNDLLKGEVDVAATAEFPLVGKAFGGQNISALATIAKTQLQDLIGRKDRGIEDISDLAGKRVGVTLGTVAEFYLGRFLDLNGLSLTNVTIVNVGPSESVDAITNGSVDAIIIWQPYAYTIETLLGSNAVIWSPQSSQLTFIVEVARNDWISQHPDVVNRFLTALAQAQDYLDSHPAESEAMVQRKLNYTDAYKAAVWPKNVFSVSLDQSLVVAMESEARWMIANNIVNATSVPNFLEYIHLDGLVSVKPDSVTIIR
jgi:NitT/TauT family transport system substrate-binding protein